MVSGFGGGTWHLGLLHRAMRPVSFDGSVLSDAVALGCWIWAAPDVALFNGMTSSMARDHTEFRTDLSTKEHFE